VTASRPVEAATARQRFAEFERAMVELGETIAQAAADPDERAMVAARLANLKPQDTLRRGPVPPIGGPSVTEAQAARLLNVGKQAAP
jgi:hypothetical protein